jgi:hypothetical protein
VRRYPGTSVQARISRLSERVRQIGSPPRKPYASVLPRPKVFARPTPAEKIAALSARLTKDKVCVCKHSRNDHLPWRPGKKRKRECLHDDCRCTDFNPR